MGIYSIKKSVQTSKDTSELVVTDYASRREDIVSTDYSMAALSLLLFISFLPVFFIPFFLILICTTGRGFTPPTLRKKLSTEVAG